MSFDLAVWKAAGPLEAGEAGRLYRELCGDRVPPSVLRSEAMNAFHGELASRWPFDEDNPDDCPFEDLQPSDRFQILNIAWSRSDELAPKIVRIALKHGLVCFDPQKGTIHQGGGPGRPWWKFWA